LNPEQFIAEIDRAIPSERAPAFSIDIDRSVVAALDSEQQVHVLRIVREATSNVVRHAQAVRSRITLARDKGRIRLEIADDGRGVAADREASGGVGVAHIYSRARKLRGVATVTSEAQSGTRVLVQFPEKT
jgi:signal transduction histidine kinase